MQFARLRAAGLGLATFALMVPGVTYAAPASTPTGSVTGMVTCGTSANTPASHVSVIVEGTNVQTNTSGTGIFTLTGLPVGQSFTIDALADPQASVVTSRYDVVAQPDQTLDIGDLDLGVCPSPPAVPAQYTVTDDSGQQQLDNPADD